MRRLATTATKAHRVRQAKLFAAVVIKCTNNALVAADTATTTQATGTIKAIRDTNASTSSVGTSIDTRNTTTIKRITECGTGPGNIAELSEASFARSFGRPHRPNSRALNVSRL